MSDPIDPDATASGARRREAHGSSATDAAAPVAARRLHEAMPSRIGRFQLLERAGKGAMGIVYAAYDPELDRRVAIKLVLAEVDSTEYADRLRREARAMARVVHANVVAVHDVGIFEGRPFIAMDFVTGCDLRAYLTRERPPWRTIVALYVQAARGLAAAHAVEVIHRDFKPDNVLVSLDKDGQPHVRVADFGLASAAKNEHEAEGVEAAGNGQGGSGTPLYTRSGAGTPAYMAAERWLGERATAASDQFSLCVALFEALAGRRPFVGHTLPMLGDAITRGERGPIPEGSEVPRWIWAAIDRGLARDPAARHPDMSALIEAVLADPSRRRRRVMAVAVVGLAAVGSVAGVQIADARARSECAAEAERAVESFWSTERHDVLSRAFARIDAPHAAEAWAHIEQSMSRYADRFGEAHRSLCIAHAVEHSIDDDLFDRRADCLEVRQVAADLLVSELEGVTPRHVASTPELARGLPAVILCDDTRTLYERPALPEDPDVRSRILELRRAIGKLTTPRLANHPTRDMLARAEAVVADAESLGYASTTAEALMELAAQQILLQRFGDAETSLVRAIEVAAHGDDVVFEADAWLMLLWLVGEREPARIEDLARGATAAVDRVANNERLYAKLETIRGSLAAKAGDYANAIGLEERALARWEGGAEDAEPAIARLHNNLGWAHQMAGDLEAARGQYEQALAIKEAMIGPRNPELATTLHNLGMIARQQHDLATARARLERALALTIASVGDDHPRVANVLSELAGTLREVGDRPAAIAAAERGLAILAKSEGDYAALRAELQAELDRARQ